MSRIKLVVEIDEEKYRLIKSMPNVYASKEVCEAIRNGTPYNPTGKWYEYISKGLLKARHGDYVIYKVDFLLNNLTREVCIMESARRMKGGAE